MKIRTFILLALITQLCSCQNIRSNIGNLVVEIEKNNRLDSEFIGESGRESQQFARFHLLDSLITEEESIILTEYKSPVVRCAAFIPLCRLNPEYSKKILIKHLHDNDTLKVQNGCMGSYSNVGNEYLNIFFNSLAKKDSIISPENKAFVNQLRQIILQDSTSKLYYRTVIINELETTAENYNIIRKIAISGTEPMAIITLSKYKKEQDKPLIIKALGNEETEIYAIYAVKNFPDKEFFPYLVKVFNTEWQKKRYSYSKWRIVYQALAKYPNEPETLQLFERTITVSDKFRKKTLGEYLWMAVTKYPDPKFESYKSRITIEDSFSLREEMNRE